MKRAVTWYEDWLKDLRNEIAVKRGRILKAQEEIATLEDDARFLSLQLEEAKKRGLSSFNDKRFMIKLDDNKEEM